MATVLPEVGEAHQLRACRQDLRGPPPRTFRGRGRSRQLVWRGRLFRGGPVPAEQDRADDRGGEAESFRSRHVR